MKTVFHIDSIQANIVNQAFNNMENMCEAEEDGKIVCIVNTGAVQILSKDSRFRNRVEKLSENGVEFKACSNSISNKSGMEKTDILDEVGEIVDSGVVAISKLQSEGYSYIKP